MRADGKVARQCRECHGRRRVYVIRAGEPLTMGPCPTCGGEGYVLVAAADIPPLPPPLPDTPGMIEARRQHAERQERLAREAAERRAKR